MEEEKRTIRLIHRQKLEHVPELLHRIQSSLPPKEAARTCVLSRSCLHAWSTIPNLRFPQFGSKSKQRRYISKVVERRIRDDIPFEQIDMSINIVNHKSASFAEKWIGLIATKSCLKELCLSIGHGNIGSFTMPDEIFSSNKLYKISITGKMRGYKHSFLIIRNPVINCVALRVSELWDVSISEDVLQKLLSACLLIEKIELLRCKGLKNIKVRNLHYLSELKIEQSELDQNLELYDVPNIRSFDYCSRFRRDPLLLDIGSLGCVTKLTLEDYSTTLDESFFDMLKSRFQSLESLTLGMISNSRSLDITCPPLKRLHIRTSFARIQVYAPKLHFFHYDGSSYYDTAMPSIVFPAIAPVQIKLELHIDSVDDKFFPNIAEALMLSSEFDIELGAETFALFKRFKIDIDDLKTRFMIPTKNVENLSIQTYSDQDWWEHSPFFDAFFLICHPKHVVAYQDIEYTYKNYFCKLMLKEVLEKKTGKESWSDYLKGVEIKNDLDGGNWETLTSSWKDSLEESSLGKKEHYEFRLHWDIFFVRAVQD